MNIVCFGLSHRTAAVEVRERFAFADQELPAATLRLRALDHLRGFNYSRGRGTALTLYGPAALP